MQHPQNRRGGTSIQVDPNPKVTITYNNGTFFMNGSPHCTIKFDSSGANVGCHRLSLEAMNVLAEEWNDFMNKFTVKVLQP